MTPIARKQIRWPPRYLRLRLRRRCRTGRASPVAHSPHAPLRYEYGSLWNEPYNCVRMCVPQSIRTASPSTVVFVFFCSSGNEGPHCLQKCTMRIEANVFFFFQIRRSQFPSTRRKCGSSCRLHRAMPKPQNTGKSCVLSYRTCCLVLSHCSCSITDVVDLIDRGMFGTLATVVREEGAVALWKGIVPGFHRQCLVGGLRVTMYDPVRAHHAMQHNVQ